MVLPLNITSHSRRCSLVALYSFKTTLAIKLQNITNKNTKSIQPRAATPTQGFKGCLQLLPIKKAIVCATATHSIRQPYQLYLLLFTGRYRTNLHPSIIIPQYNPFIRSCNWLTLVRLLFFPRGSCVVSLVSSRHRHQRFRPTTRS
jgi:hypothetical protein